MSEQDWRNCFGLLQLRLRELEQRIRDLDAAIETNETAIQDLSFLHFPNARHHPRVGQEDTERGDVESEIV
jgi:hypothetical protein